METKNSQMVPEKRRNRWWVLLIIGVCGLLILIADFRYKGFHLKTEFITMQDSSNIEQSSQSARLKRSGRWIYNGRHVDSMLSEENVNYLNDLIGKWMDGKATDNELTEWMTQYVQKLGIPIQTVGVMSRQQCLFASEKEIPDFETRWKESNGIYEFIGLYTEEEVNETGELVCYYWEAGVR